ncbi:hypothetical protein JCM3775_003549 [Rhodotorula graminis]
MSAPAADAQQQQQQPPVAPAEERALALFARSALDLFDMWPALRLAISHGWGGDGKEGKTAIAEDVVDLFYSAATSGSAGASSASAGAGASSSLMEQGIPLPAADDVAATLLYVVGNEFDVDLEDGSEVLVARDLVALWRECLGRVLATPAGGDSPEGELAQRFREGAERARAQDRGGARFEARREGGGDEDESSDEGSEFDESGSDDEMDGIEEEEHAPQLVETRPREEPVVDEDGFELVQTKKKGGRR